MATTYSGDPSQSDKDKLRFHIGDVDEDAMHLSDEEITYILDAEDTFQRAVVSALDRIVHRLANEVTSSLGPSQVNAEQRYKQYKQLLHEARENLFAARPFAGGVTKSDKRARERDDSLTKPYFYRSGVGGYDKPRP